jgi:hypothetical protein
VSREWMDYHAEQIAWPHGSDQGHKDCQGSDQEA